ncbi:MAG: hypothetical protein FVQ80_05975 [Planctomycetes bacterium]|nr:hypothetical protein [Planctomycetota bacterium]
MTSKIMAILKKQKRVILYCAALMPIILTSGCADLNYTQNPNFYYINSEKNFSKIGKVVIVELDNMSAYPQISTDVTKSLFQAVQKMQAFSLEVIAKNDPKWKSLQLKSSNDKYDINQLYAIRKTLKCDAIIVGTITNYSPYPHMSIGIRLKLIDLADGKLLWAVEQVWDTADNNTEYRIKKYFKRKMRPDSAALEEHKLINVSPIKFVKFITYEIAETLKFVK